MDGQRLGTPLAHGSKVSPFVQMICKWQLAILSISVVTGCTADQAKGLVSTDSNFTSENVRIKKIEIVAADGRSVPFEIIYPDFASEYPLIVFSHGAFSSPDRYYALLKPIAAAGYVLVAPMHIDSEDFEQANRPSQSRVWQTRGEDIALALSKTAAFGAVTKKQEVKIDFDNIATMGHSYGALIAQMTGGTETLRSTSLQRTPVVKAVVSFSPPGITPGLIDRSGWFNFSLPNLTITGTSDVLPGFIDDWKVHKHSYEYASVGQRWLWVGEGVDHYFGGMIGREKPASQSSQMLFSRAVATTVDFLDKALKEKTPSRLGSKVPGESLTRDGDENE